MHALFEIITWCLVKILLVCSVFLWVLCESRHLLGIGTRLGVISDGELLHAYTTGMRTTGVLTAFSDMEHEHFRRDKPTIPTEIWIFIVLVFFIFIALCIYFCVLCHIRRRRLWGNVNANPQVPRPETSPTEPQEVVRQSVSDNDVPPDYTVVVDQKIMAANANDSLNDFPKVVGGKKLETPPPAYTTVAPFK